MENRFRFFKFVLTVMFVCFSVTAFSLDGFIPQWTVGQTWHVKAHYRNIHSKAKKWLEPITWNFKVRGEKVINGELCYVLQIVPDQIRHMKTLGILFLSKKDLHAVKVIDIFQVDGKAKSQERIIGGSHISPLLRNDSMVPYDLPLFPLSAPASVDNTGASFGGENAVKIDGVNFLEDTSQTCLSDGKGFVVILRSSNGKGNMEQKWNPDFPWAVSMTSSAMEYQFEK
ncbi:MAG: hypothetical protein HQM08_22640 [Candidatus Riflebacteria bacterium]|nr:hypothetical protein [Candidatus Riflebacteria bacterium]